jgi:signal transduction histidine kinase
MSFWRFIQSKWRGIAFFAGLLIVVLGLNWLDKANRMLPANTFYMLVLVLCMGAVYLYISYLYERRAQEKLRHMIESGKLLDFPVPDSVKEELYQQIIDDQARRGERAIESLEESRREELAFLLAWVHRMKTPIAAARLVMERDRLSPDKKTIESLEEEIDRIAEGVEKVLYYVRQSDFSEEYVIEEVPLSTIVTDSVKKHSRLFIGRRISLIQEDLDYRVLTDRKWAGFVLDQLLSNALKYTPEGGRIHVGADKKAREIVLTVQDTGPGIRPEDLKRVFNRSFTGFNGRMEAASTGMGLYLARNLCEKLNHKLTVESAPGEGTRASIHFPRYIG